MRLVRALLGAWLLVCLGTFVPHAVAQQAASDQVEKIDLDMVKKIRDEGMQRSKVMETASFLTDVHGPRLTNSPEIRKAGEWTKGKLSEWGLKNARMETWGPFGRGWSMEKFTANMTAPQFAPLIAYPKAWSPSTPTVVKGEPIYLDAATEADLDKYRGKLHRAIVMISGPREVKALFDPPAKRQTDESLLSLANSAGTRPFVPTGPGLQGNSGAGPSKDGDGTGKGDAKPGAPAGKDAAAKDSKPSEAAGQPGAKPGDDAARGQRGGRGGPGGGTPEQRAALSLQTKKWQLVYDEGAAVVIEPGRGDGGTVFVAAAQLPPQPGLPGGGGLGPRRSTPWAKDSPAIVPQVVMAVEQYNRILRMKEKGASVQLEFDLASRYHEDDLMAFNLLAEIPGTDLADEVVMLGAHFDSWHAGTGATDNAVGCAVALEAVRILQAIGAKPRRTIRIGLWTGEEQGILGSRAYVDQHFGTTVTPSGRGGDGPAAKDAGAKDSGAKDSAAKDSAAKDGAAETAVKDAAAGKDSAAKDSAAKDGQPRGGFGGRRRDGERETVKFALKPDHAKFSAYFNLDNGTGKVRGVYLQGNEALRPIFRAWLTPLNDLGATTLTSASTGGTDHLSFDRVGLPGFQFIQDPLEYDSRTHHSSMDVYDRLQEDDVKQASVVMATFVYLAAMRDEKLPRKPLGGEVVPPEAAQK